MDLRKTERGIRIFNHCVGGFILCVVAIFIWPIMSNTAQSAQNSNYLTITSTNTVGTLNTMIGNASTHKDGTAFGLLYQISTLAAKVGILTDAGTGTLNAATGTITKAGNTLDAGTGTIKQAGVLIATTDTQVAKIVPMAAETKKKIDAAVDVYATLPVHLNPVFDNTAELVNSLNDFAADQKTALLRDRFSGLLLSLTGFTDKGTVLEGDVHNYTKPYGGNHPKLNEVKTISLGLLGLGSKGAQAMYFGVGAVHGQ